MKKTFLQKQKEEQERNDRVDAILDKIKGKMKEYKGVAPTTARRVLLELLQNAKDAAQPSGVNVEIIVSNDYLVFRHDGTCFQINHVNGLVDRISRKNRDGAVDLNNRKTGRFGTGFICTHLLGEDVIVKGVVMLETDDLGSKQFKRFEIPLKVREDDAELRKCLLESEECLDELWTGNGGEDLGNEHTSSGFETEFIYDIRKSQEYVDIALKDCLKTLPLTLAANPKICSVRVKDERTGNDAIDFIFRSQVSNVRGNINEVLIYRNEEVCNKYFVYSNCAEDPETSIILPVSLGNEVLPVDPSIPKLLVDFPLIGTEDFRLPFFLNCWKFEPNTERNGIALTGIGVKADMTRDLLSNALSLYPDFVDFLIESNVENRYNLLSTNVASISSKWDSNDAKWIKGIQEWWRSQLTGKSLVKTDCGNYISLNEMVLPECPLDNLQNLKKLMEPFVGNKKLPAQKIVKECHKVLNEDYGSWKIPFKLSVKDFVKQISNFGTLSKLQEKLAFEEDNTVNWIGNVCSFLASIESINLLNDISILPNERGEFKKITDLNRCNPDDIIEDSFKDIAEFAHSTYDWRTILLDKRLCIEEVNVVSTTQIYNDIKDAYDKILKKENASKTNDLNYDPSFPRSLELAVKVMALKPEAETGGKTYDFANRFHWNFEIPERNAVANQKGFQWSVFESRLLEATCNVTAKSETLKGLSSLINMSESDCVAWVDDLISLCWKNDFHKKFVEKEHGVWLNQNGEFCQFENIIGVESDTNPITDELKDLSRDSELIDHDWRYELLHLDSVHSDLFKDIFEQKDVLEEIDKVLANYNGDKQDPVFSKVVFALNLMIPDIISENNLKSYMVRFNTNKNNWIVGAINDPRRMSHIAQLATVDDATFDDTVELYNLVKDNNLTLDAIKRLVSAEDNSYDDLRDDIQKQRDIETGRRGEEIALKVLESNGFSEVKWLNKDGESKEVYDIIAKKGGVKYFFDVKSTITSFNDSRKIDFYVSKPQFDFANNIANGDRYNIIRVFDVNRTPTLKFLEVKDDSIIKN